LNTKNLGNSTSFLLLIQLYPLNGLENIEFDNRRRCCILFLDRTAAERILNFQTRIGQNSGSPEYHFGRKLSQFSDGPINGSKWLAICELRQSETRPVAKTIFLADHTYLYKTGLWQNFSMTSPEYSHTKNVANKLSFPLVTHTTHFGIGFGHYGNWKLCFSSGHAMDRLKYRCSVRFLGRKMGETR
jgi:hypothetical protein